MSEVTLSDPRYKVERTCQACQGEGRRLKETCPACGEPVSKEIDWWHQELLLCGHEAAAVQVDCEVCEGSGTVDYILSETEYQQLRRKKIIRGIFLLILALIPLILLLIAILTREPDLLFGSPWY